MAFAESFSNERPKTIRKKDRGFGSVIIMTEYFVAGGTYTNQQGEDCFDLVCPGRASHHTL